MLVNFTGDFTPVCTTEFVAFSQAYPQFEALGATLLGLSIDSNPSHLDWVYTIKELTGITVPFPVVADRNGDVARLYGMIAPNVSSTETVRNVFFIDPNQTIRAILIYPLTNGRSIPEILRLLHALQTTDEYGVVTPANWTPGQPVLVHPQKHLTNSWRVRQILTHLAYNVWIGSGAIRKYRIKKERGLH